MSKAIIFVGIDKPLLISIKKEIGKYFSANKIQNLVQINVNSGCLEFKNELGSAEKVIISKIIERAQQSSKRSFKFDFSQAA